MWNQDQVARIGKDVELLLAVTLEYTINANSDPESQFAVQFVARLKSNSMAVTISNKKSTDRKEGTCLATRTNSILIRKFILFFPSTSLQQNGNCQISITSVSFQRFRDFVWTQKKLKVSVNKNTVSVYVWTVDGA